MMYGGRFKSLKVVDIKHTPPCFQGLDIQTSLAPNFGTLGNIARGSNIFSCELIITNISRLIVFKRSQKPLLCFLGSQLTKLGRNADEKTTNEAYS